MNKIFVALMGLVLMLPQLKAGEIETTISRVVVYEDRAMVTRIGEVSLPAGAGEVTVSDLPPGFLDDSVRVSGQAEVPVTITGTEVRKTFLTDPRREEVDKLAEEIEGLKEDRAAIDNGLETLLMQRKFIASIQSSVPEKISVEMLQASPQPGEWNKVIEFIGQSSQTVFAEERKLKVEKRELEKKIEALEKKLSQIESFVSKEAKEIAVSVEAARPSTLKLEISYVIRGATWRPVYDARAVHDRGLVDFTYRAEVRQKTGEDWKDVSLALSTARPSIGGRPAELSPWYISIYQPPERSKGIAYSMGRAPAAPPMEVAEAGLYAVRGMDEEKDMEVSFDQARAEKAGAAVTFEIPRRQEIPSDGAFHGMSVDRMEIKAEFFYTATPKLAEYAYLTARCQNRAAYPLLAGKVNLFLGPDFVGTSSLETVAPGEKYDLYLGIDEDIKIERELVGESTEKGGLFKGGTGYKQYSFRITLENFRSAPAEITVFDQIPVSQSPEITVELDKAAPEPVKIADREQPGILSWKLTVPAGGKKTIEFGFTVEYPKNKELSGL
ncbi:MAG: mucoidy inhibitor MuiA family protein [PVC group bacterium]